MSHYSVHQEPSPFSYVMVANSPLSDKKPIACKGTRPYDLTRGLTMLGHEFDDHRPKISGAFSLTIVPSSTGRGMTPMKSGAG